MIVHLQNPNIFKQEKTNTPRPAVLLCHGLVDSSDAWVVNGKKNSVGFILADAGYDVWMGNFRGNKYSYRHKTLDSKNDWEYWDHGIATDISKYDMPAFLNYVTEYSKVPKVTVMSHSMGTTV